jgi:hypothetical protein
MGECAICRRYGPDLPIQRHHLVPEHRKESPVVEVCPPCHDTIHATFTNGELIESYHTIEDLRSADRMQDYLNWIRRTKKTAIDVDTSNHVRERRGSR